MRVEVGADGLAVRPQQFALVREDLGVPVKFVYSAYCAAILSVTFSPPPAIQIGMPPSCSGSGRTIAPSTW